MSPDAFVGGGLLATVFGLVAGGTYLGMRRGALDRWASSIHKRTWSFATHQQRLRELQQQRQKQRRRGVEFEEWMRTAAFTSDDAAGFHGPGATDFEAYARAAFREAADR